MTVEFLPDQGHRLSFEGRSLLLNGISVSKPGATLSDRQILTLAWASREYLSAITGRPAYRRGAQTLTDAEARPPSTNVAYKFTDDAGLAFWQRGSIRLTPPAVYHAIENEHAQDRDEGFGMVYLRGKKRSATFYSRAGFNSLILCTSADARLSERIERAAKFGSRLLRINDVRAFSTRIAGLAGAEHFTVRDVTYSDAMAVKGFSDLPDVLVEINGLGDLKESALAHLAEHCLDRLIRVTEPVSIFTKPSRFWRERERRFQFALSSDVNAPLTVQDRALADMIDVIV